MDTLLQDLRYGVRQLIRTPGFTIVAAVTLAIGIGANTALFSFANAILARPLPGVNNAKQLVWVAPVTSQGGHATMMSYPDFVDYRDSSGAFSTAVAMSDDQFSISSGGEPVRVRGQHVSAGYFETLGAHMALGRDFLPEEDRTPGTHPVAVLSYRFWQERYGGALGIIGKRVTINGKPYTIVGVTPQKFNGADHAEPRDVWVPIMMVGSNIPDQQRLLTNRGSWWLRAIARLKPTVSEAGAKVAVATQAARIASIDTATHRGMTASVFPVRSGLGPNDGNDIVPVAGLAAAVTLLVLLIACANVSNLLLGRAVARRREIAVRLSLGAARSRILRQLLTESLLLATLGTATGFLLALWATDVMASIIPAPIDVTPDQRVLYFTLAIAFLTGLAFGVVPALHATRAEVTAALKDATVGFDRRRSRLQAGFVTAQVSLSLVLLVMAGMFLSALVKASRVDVHFDATKQVLAASFDPALQGYAREKSDAFLAEVKTRAQALPGVEAVTITNQVPMSERHIGADIALESETPVAPRRFGGEAGLEVFQTSTQPDYFRAVGIPLAHGRDFTKDDVKGAPLVAIVSEDFARAAWPKEDPIGKRFRMNTREGPFITVVGVAREALTMGLTERKRPIVYTPLYQQPFMTDLTILVRSAGDASALGMPVRKVLRDMDPDMPVYSVQTLAQYRVDRQAESKLGSTLLAIAGGLALLLATVGVYAVMAFSVGQRTREIGVRVALGAVSQQIVCMFIGEGVRLTIVGVVIGLALSAAAAKVLSSLFLGVQMSDALAFVAVSLILVAAAMAASWIPARRAALVDPMVALRNE